MTAKPGRLFVVSGPSGVGKSTLLKKARKDLPNLSYSVSLTTRAPRKGEVDGVHYHFVSRPEFKERVERGEMAEWAEVVGNLYGTSALVLEERLAQGDDVLLEIEVQGAHQIKKRFKQAVFIFIMPPSWEVLESRLRGRGTEEEEVVRRRLELAKAELDQAHWYDHQVVNDDLERAAMELVRLMS